MPCGRRRTPSVAKSTRPSTNTSCLAYSFEAWRDELKAELIADGILGEQQKRLLENVTNTRRSAVSGWRGESKPAWWDGAEHGARTYAEIPGFAKAATTEQIEKHGYVLTPGRYVGVRGAGGGRRCAANGGYASAIGKGQSCFVTAGSPAVPRFEADEVVDHLASSQRVTAMIGKRLADASEVRAGAQEVRASVQRAIRWSVIALLPSTVGELVMLKNASERFANSETTL